MHKKLFATLLLLPLAVAANCQQLSLTLIGGSTIPNDSEVTYIQHPTWGVNAELVWPALMEDTCRAPFHLGFRTNYAHIPDGIAGDRLNLEGLVTMPLFTERLEMIIAGGFGLYNRPKERTNDPMNLFIGSYLNCAIDLGLRYSHPLPDGSRLLLGGTFVHNSNGYLHKPNQGLNYLQCEAGWQLAPKAAPAAADTLRFSDRYRAHSAPFLYAALGLSVPRHLYATNDIFYPAYTLQGGYRYAFHPCRSIGLTLDATYNFADYYSYKIAKRPYPVPLLLGTTLMYETHWGPLSLRVGMGAHLYKSNKDYPVYERVGLFYHFRDPRHSIGVALRAYYAHVDFIEWGYSFDIIKN